MTWQVEVYGTRGPAQATYRVKAKTGAQAINEACDRAARRGVRVCTAHARRGLNVELSTLALLAGILLSSLVALALVAANVGEVPGITR